MDILKPRDRQYTDCCRQESLHLGNFNLFNSFQLPQNFWSSIQILGKRNQSVQWTVKETPYLPIPQVQLQASTSPPPFCISASLHSCCALHSVPPSSSSEATGSAGGWGPGRDSFCVLLLASASFCYVPAWVAHRCSPSRIPLSQGVLPVGSCPSEQHLLCHGTPAPRACHQAHLQQHPLLPLLCLPPPSQMLLSLKWACSEVPHTPAAALAGGGWFTAELVVSGWGWVLTPCDPRSDTAGHA